MRRFKRRAMRRRSRSRKHFKNPFPTIQRVALRFACELPVQTVDPGNATPALRTIATNFQAVKMNDPLDPLALLDTAASYNTQPAGFDQYAALYESYFVGDALYTVHFRRTMLGTNDFVGYCGIYVSEEDDITNKITRLNKLISDAGTLNAGNAMQEWFNDPGVIMKRIDVTHETDAGIKMQFHYKRGSFFKGHKALGADFQENACGVYSGGSWTAPTETAYVWPWICLQYRNGETYSETYSVHCQVSIVYHTTFTELRDNVLIDSSTNNDAVA